MSESEQGGPSGGFEADETESRPQHENNNSSRRERQAASTAEPAEEVGGPAGPEPTRYGDWERKGRCIDF